MWEDLPILDLLHNIVSWHAEALLEGTTPMPPGRRRHWARLDARASGERRAAIGLWRGPVHGGLRGRRSRPAAFNQACAPLLPGQGRVDA